ncbi:hypothetical protein T10_1228 [Trichinella papuae]|uniref:Uncharacterized protein n=1 Tax=Trichinella papuae TaxID=268474 RepID=A0A0V1MJC1_9BILA|nr:hypothetical protein T10_1228 [Trichinella papuae]
MNHGHYESKIVDRCLSDVDDRKRERDARVGVAAAAEVAAAAHRLTDRPTDHPGRPIDVQLCKCAGSADAAVDSGQGEENLGQILIGRPTRAVSARETMAKSRAEQVDRTADFTSIQQPVH